MKLNFGLSAAIIALLCEMFSPVMSSAQVSVEHFNLDEQTAAVFEKCRQSIYSPANIAIGDSIYQVGVSESSPNKQAAGLFIHTFACMGTGQFDVADSLLLKVVQLTKPVDELHKVMYEAYRYLSQIKLLLTDYYGSTVIAKDLLTTAEAFNDVEALVSGYESMGLSFVLRDNPRVAERYFLSAIKVAEDNGLEEMVATTYLQLANCYEAMKDGKKTEYYLNKSIERIDASHSSAANKETLKLYRLMFSTINMSDQEYIDRVDASHANGTFYSCLAPEYQYSIMARYYSLKRLKQKALMMADSISSINNRVETKEIVYTHFGDWENAYRCRSQLYQLHDSLQAVILSEDFAFMDADLNNAQLRVEAAELRDRNRTQMMIAIAIFALFVIGAVVINGISRRRRLVKHQLLLQSEVDKKTAELKDKNCELEEQKEEIQAQNDKLEQYNHTILQINKEMTASINYAQRIQAAILPDLATLSEGKIKGSFVVYRPYKIVSGDFYWARRHGDKIIYVCADCTGHGVPGALMSMIGSTLLNEICSVDVLPSPSDILESLDRQLKQVTSQHATLAIQDGMDLSIVVFDPSTRSISYSSARRPLFVAHMGSVTTYKGVKRSIGDKDEKSSQIPFETSSLQLTSGDTIYLFSDGIVDQFGGQEVNGPSGKRLKNSGLTKMLENVCSMTARDQGQEVERLLDKWQGTCAQVDDICMVGIKV